MTKLRVCVTKLYVRDVCQRGVCVCGTSEQT